MIKKLKKIITLPVVFITTASFANNELEMNQNEILENWGEEVLETSNNTDIKNTFNLMTKERKKCSEVISNFENIKKEVKNSLNKLKVINQTKYKTVSLKEIVSMDVISPNIPTHFCKNENEYHYQVKIKTQKPNHFAQGNELEIININTNNIKNIKYPTIIVRKNIIKNLEPIHINKRIFNNDIILEIKKIHFNKEKKSIQANFEIENHNNEDITLKNIYLNINNGNGIFLTLNKNIDASSNQKIIGETIVNNKVLNIIKNRQPNLKKSESNINLSINALFLLNDKSIIIKKEIDKKLDF